MSAAALYFPEHWDSMLAAVHNAAMVGTDVPIVIGKQRTAGAGGSAPPTVPLPYVVLDMLAPPKQSGEPETRRVQAARFEAPSPPPSGAQTYLLQVNGSVFTVDVDAGSPLTTAALVRDAMVAAVNAGAEPVKAGPLSGTDALWVTPAAGARLPRLNVDTSALVRLQLAEYRFAENTATFTLEAVARWPVSAAAISGAIRLGMESQAGLDALNAGGWGWAGVPAVRERDLTFAGLWEDRSGFDLRLNCRSRRIDLVDYIESAAIVGAANP